MIQYAAAHVWPRPSKPWFHKHRPPDTPCKMAPVSPRPATSRTRCAPAGASPYYVLHHLRRNPTLKFRKRVGIAGTRRRPPRNDKLVQYDIGTEKLT